MCTVQVESSEAVLQLLTRISESILNADDFYGALDSILKLTTEELGAASGSIAIPDSSGNHLKFISVYNHNPEEIRLLNKETPLAVNEGVVGAAFSQDQILQVQDIYKSSSFKQVQIDGPEEYRSLLAVPLNVKDETIGVINFTFKEKTRLSNKNRFFLDIVGNHIAIAIRQGKLNEKLQKSNKKLTRLARADSLTGLLNHRRIHEVLVRELDRARRYEKPLAVVMADIDYFKEINDSYGHPAGDFILKTLADIFEEEIRSIDSVGRYGGEEFLFVLPETDGKAALNIAERIRKKVAKKKITAGNNKIQLTLSAGVSSAIFPSNSKNASELVSSADRALYRAKAAGRNCCRMDSFVKRESDYQRVVNFD
ncbi:MAG: diguanylate cyclase [bacterium]